MHSIFFSDDGSFTALFAVPKGFKAVRQQYYFYRWQFSYDVLLFQVGKFYEFYHHQDDRIVLSLGLQRMRSNRRGARFGFPVVRESYYCQVLLQQGLAVLFIRETEGVCDKLRQRLPVARILSA